jgi:hypothetical protein
MATNEEALSTLFELMVEMYAHQSVEVHKLVKPAPPIRAHVTRDLTFQDISVQRTSSQYEIRIGIGLFYILYSMFVRALQSPSFMPWLEKSSGSPNWNWLRPGEVKPWWGRDKRMRSVIDSIMATGVTPDSGASLSRSLFEPGGRAAVAESFKAALDTKLPGARTRAAAWLTIKAIHFILGHEVRHVLAGHLDYYMKETPSFTEVSESRVHRSTAYEHGSYLEQWVMEADADQYSARVLLNGLIREYKESESGVPNEVEEHSGS